MAEQHSSRSIMYATVVVAILLVVVIVPFSLNDGSTTSQVGEDVELRIRPVARFELKNVEGVSAEGDVPAEARADEGEDAAVSEDGGATTTSVTAPRDGAAVYALICFTCHDLGVAGAPKKGDKAGWAARIATGKEALYASVLNGKGAMPAKGGNPSLSEDEIKGAVDYMVGLAE
jgi:cytochrome c5